MRVCYLNLRRRADRNAQFLRWNAAVAELDRVEAVDGTSVTIEELVRDGVIREPLKHFTAGSLGCTASHKKMWERAVAEQAVLTVAEDDAVLNRHFAEKVPDLLARLPPDWDIVLWGWNFDALLHVEIIPGLKRATVRSHKQPLGPRLAEFQSKDYEACLFPLIAAFGTVCYSISPKGAEQLLRRCFPLKRERILVPGMKIRLPNNTIDVVLIQHYRNVKSYVCLPPLAWTENDKSGSDIEPKRSWLNRVGRWVYGRIWGG